MIAYSTLLRSSVLRKEIIARSLYPEKITTTLFFFVIVLSAARIVECMQMKICIFNEARVNNLIFSTRDIYNKLFFMQLIILNTLLTER